MSQRNSRTQSSRRACCNDCASAPSELASRVFVNSRTNAGMITRSRKSLRAGSRGHASRNWSPTLEDHDYPVARGAFLLLRQQNLHHTHVQTFVLLSYFVEFAIPRWQQLGDCGAGSSHFRRQFFERAAIKVCMDSFMVYVYSTMKRHLQRGNAVRDARTRRDSASPTVAHPNQ